MIVCDTTENTVRQGYCYTCLTTGGYFGRVTKELNETFKDVAPISPPCGVLLYMTCIHMLATAAGAFYKAEVWKGPCPCI